VRTYRMPTTIVLLFFSWLVAFIGLAWAVAQVVIFRFNNINVLISSAAVLLMSLFLAAIIRTFANIAQILFDFKSETEKVIFPILKDINSLVRENKEGIAQGLCSLDKVRQDIYEIKSFFEKIEKRLDFNKAQEKG